MTQKPARTAHFQAVIADLKAKRAEIDSLIEQLEAFEKVTAAAWNLRNQVVHGVRPETTFTEFSAREHLDFAPVPEELERLSFSLVGMPDTEHMSLGEACTAILKHAKKPIMLREIVSALVEIGFGSSENLKNNVGSALYHRAKVRKDIERAPPKHWKYVGNATGLIEHVRQPEPSNS